MSLLKHAISLAKEGFHIFPLAPNSKKQPIFDDFTSRSTTDEEQIKSWWAENPNYNIAIATSKFGSEGALVVVDVDMKKGKNGENSLFQLELEGKELPDTFTQFTPTGGKHLFYVHREPVKQGTNVLGDGLDIRSNGGFVVGKGSLIDGVPYTAKKKDIRTAPEWLVLDCGKAREKRANVVEAEFKVNEQSAMVRAVHYLNHEAPLAIEGEAGDQTTYKVAARVKDLGIKQDECFYLMGKFWNDRCLPPWSMDDLVSKVANAYRYGNEPVGASAPEAQFTPVEMTPAEVHYLHQINQDHALVLMEGTYMIIHETVDEKGLPKRNYLNEAAFKRKWSPYTVQKNVTYAQQWLDWRNRREYAGICFAPGREARNNYYNLWRGFTATPLSYSDANEAQRKGFDMFMSHTKENISRGDESLFRWIMGYFAHMVQKPYERPLTTIVFRGGKGVGKNALVDRIGKLIQGHYIVAHNRRFLTSNFNGHMDSCLCMVLDEAFWSGDKDAEGQLKGITTSPEILIERKGKEPYTVDNLVRLVIIGNENWLVPASNDERRYAVYDVGDGRKQDKKFFHDMRVMMDEEGGNRILLHYLQSFDLSTVDVNDAPKTQALLEQKEQSLDPFEQWWHGCLTEGKITHSDFSDEWEIDVSKDKFRDAFYRFCRERNIRSRLPDSISIGKMMSKTVPDVKSTKIRNDDGKAYYVYRLPSLEECRKAWEKHIGQTVTWE